MPQEEGDWVKLEQFRRALLRIVEGEEWLLVDSPEEASAIAVAVESYAGNKFVDEVGEGCRAPEGARLLVDGAKTKEQVIAAVSGIGNGDKWLRYLSRPLGAQRAILTDSFRKGLFGHKRAQEIAGGAPGC